MVSFRQELERRFSSGLDPARKVEEGIRRFLAPSDIRLEFQKNTEKGEMTARVIHNPSGRLVREYSVNSILKLFSGFKREI
ncbi:MAG: hypothetical protein HY892_15145 [Deltaproteobacteria bacterium]|nr:hypothetical protein [Deltaproteobacteria bacterium]